jgi:proline iminopeptidase
VVLGSSFGGFVVATYAAMFPDHPAGIVLTNTTGGRTDHARSIEVFRRIGGEQAATVARQDFEQLTEDSAEEFNRVCYPLFSAKPGYVEETQRRLALSVRTTEVNLHYWRNEAKRADSWAHLTAVRCPVLILAGEDDPMCPIEVVEDLARQLSNAQQVELLRLPGARHAVFRDAPETAFPAVLRFLLEHAQDGVATPN